MNTKSPGQRFHEAHRNHCSVPLPPWENLAEDAMKAREAAAEEFLTAHPPKITAAQLWDINEKCCSVPSDPPIPFANLHDHSKKFWQKMAENLSTPKAPAQEQWEEFTGKQGNERLYSRVGCQRWIVGLAQWAPIDPSNDFTFSDEAQYRRPRQPQQAGKELAAAAHGNAHDRGASSPRDWLEDFKHENGNYSNQCSVCGNRFIGHKRRVVCKTCATPADPILIGGWPLKSWEDLKAFLISYSMYSEAAMIRWVMRDREFPNGGDGGTPVQFDPCLHHAPDGAGSLADQLWTLMEQDGIQEWRLGNVASRNLLESTERQRDTARSTIKSLETRLQQISKLSDEYREASIEQAKLLGEARAENTLGSFATGPPTQRDRLGQSYAK